MDHLEPGSAAAYRRNAIHAHNGLLGNVGCMRAYLKPVLASPTATDSSKMIARELWSLLASLEESLKHRKGQ